MRCVVILIKIETTKIPLKWINISMYTYVADVPVTNNKILKSPWVFQLEGKVSTSTGTYRLIPEITF
ncbi:hypothetical protein [Clostridium kluyveri]|uniref:Uncharacterized protein n=1 Tax=Clostridium kluyveri TaxID=1534 RepID=A0A1L5FBQ5_CLOKL|nr:hypothetical protein [Clostridium kluyveri]APM40250.1 hypothetical protein BS101_16655 [Clostridium kluyveri]